MTYYYVLHDCEWDDVIIQVYYLPAIVISEPDDVTVCEGRSTTFTCVLDSSISINDTEWYRFIKDTGTTERIPNAGGGDIIIVPTHSQNGFTTTLNIFNTTKSYTGYYWVRLPFDDVCNVSLTVLTSMWEL